MDHIVLGILSCDIGAKGPLSSHMTVSTVSFSKCVAHNKGPVVGFEYATHIFTVGSMTSVNKLPGELEIGFM